jgi:hypothetical protein
MNVAYLGKSKAFVTRWRPWFFACVVLGGCQLAARPPAPVSDEPCPSAGPCDDLNADSWLPPVTTPGTAVAVAVAATDNRNPIPGCPKTLQVMALVHSIRFPSDPAPTVPRNDPDPSDLTCDPPEDPLQSAGRYDRRRHMVQMAAPGFPFPN